MNKRSLTQALWSPQGGGLFSASGKPRIIDLHHIQPGDKVVLWNLDGIGENDVVKKGDVFTVKRINIHGKIIFLNEVGLPSIYNPKEDGGWEYWRFCMQEDYNESGIYLNYLNYKKTKATDFADRKIFSRNTYPLYDLGIPFEDLRREQFAVIEHPQAELSFQMELNGTSQLYLASYDGYWLMLHRIKSNTKWLIDEDIHFFSLVFMMAKEEGDKKPVVATILLGLWLFHYNSYLEMGDEDVLWDISKSYRVIKGGSKSVGFLRKEFISELLREVSGKNIAEGSEIIKRIIER